MNWQEVRAGVMRLAGLFYRQRRERELADELEFHLAMKREAGQTTAEAHRQFGGLEKWKEICRDVGRWSTLDELSRDLALAARVLRKSPAFSAVAVVTLALATGANTAIFTLMNELMVKSIPVPNASKLAMLRIQEDQTGYAFGYPSFEALEEKGNAVMQVFAFSDRSFNLHTDEGIQPTAGEFVNGEYFLALGVRAKLGRCIEPSDDRAGAAGGKVVVVSDHFWRTHMGGNREALGQTIRLGSTVFTVVGILPQDFSGVNRDRAPEIFVPLRLEPYLDSPFNLIALGYRAC